MIALIQFNLITLAVAMSVGVVTGWWLFGRRPLPAKNEDSEPS